MIDKEIYNDILNNAKTLKVEVEKLKNMNIGRISDFISTVESYINYLDSNVKLNQDADEAIKDIIK